MTLTRRAKLRREMRQASGRYCRYPDRRVGGWERLVCKYLCDIRELHYHQPQSFAVVLEGGKPITYTPDVTLENMVIEPHDPRLIGESFIQKIKAFKLGHPTICVILITKNDAIPQVPSGVFDEVVPIEHLDLLSIAIKGLIR